jgi:hypothetical protein
MKKLIAFLSVLMLAAFTLSVSFDSDVGKVAKENSKTIIKENLPAEVNAVAEVYKTEVTWVNMITEKEQSKKSNQKETDAWLIAC